MNNPSSALPPFWMIKLTEAWGELKNDSKGEDDGLKIEQGEGTIRKKIRLHAAIVRSANPYTG